MRHFSESERPLKIAVIGTGIAGLSAAWLLSQRHEVTVFEADSRIGGHCHTVDAGEASVDTGFIVYNDATYPNLSALFRHLDVPTKASDMSFAVSMDDGALEYSGTNLAGLFAQRRNLASPRFWSMLRDLVRFYRAAPEDVRGIGPSASLDEYLNTAGFGTAFREDHLYPMAAAIWSTPAMEIGDYPAVSFIRFCENHGLLKFFRRPVWRTVDGGSRAYVERLVASFRDTIRTGAAVSSVRRVNGAVEITTAGGEPEWFDHVVVGSHADQALKMLADPSNEERRLLGAFTYGRNETVLHRDASLMPRRPKVWSSWNYLASSQVDERGRKKPCVTYWMNRLQGIPDTSPLFVTLSPLSPPAEDKVIWRGTYDHPLFSATTLEAQGKLWSLQGMRNTWFCGSYFGSGFHEDAIQAGLAVAESLGGVRRPWTVQGESDRIFCRPQPALPVALEATEAIPS
ncbi:NAD(P)/FAD-dependent oxidoreductase [Mesorhizobium microcysteis]|uniref:NAD(P)/FAD-dependent oxidoreductase n=1 Tax=Neoaquamicrobium microcysteis TaxID=2682781 RepID=A0A5D4GQQ1_9HYPH|nr:NAD(P)/FAD-dependent oxidoreductase [Mesorhizobium microcysteis]TYR30648.1 NAD(P)/FAD-dependent oxidoreductase [Mesorhizobium microcysteis]